MRKGDFRFHLLDVFTDRKLSGNRLAVFDLGEMDLTTSFERGEIAREIGCPAVVFLREARDPLCAARFSVHTTSNNGTLVGHAEIGAAILIAETRAPDLLARNEIVVAFENDCVQTRCEVFKNRQGVSYAQRPASRPTPAGTPPTSEALSRALGLDARDIGFEGHEPSVFAAPTFPIVFVPVADRDVLFNAAPHPALFGQILNGAHGVYLYARETDDADCAIRARMFAAPWGAEDPATGCAAAAFAGVAMEFEKPEDGEHQLFIKQSNRLGHPSRLTLRMRVDGGALAQTVVGGQAVIVGEGVLKL